MDETEIRIKAFAEGVASCNEEIKMLRQIVDANKERTKEEHKQRVEDGKLKLKYFHLCDVLGRVYSLRKHEYTGSHEAIADYEGAQEAVLSALREK